MSDDEKVLIGEEWSEMEARVKRELEGITLTAFPKEGFIGLKVPAGWIPNPLPPGADGVMLRFNSAEGFKRFMVSAMDAAARVWPDIDAEWNDA